MDKFTERSLQLQMLVRERAGVKKFIEMGWKPQQMRARLKHLDILVRCVWAYLELERGYKITKEVEREIRSRSPARDKNDVELYLEAIERYKPASVTPDEFAKVAGWSVSTAKRRLRDKAFLANLGAALHKKVNQAKSKRTRNLWQSSLEAVHGQVDKVCQSKDALGRGRTVPYSDHIAYDDLSGNENSSEVAAVISEEIHRKVRGKTLKSRRANGDEE